METAAILPFQRQCRLWEFPLVGAASYTHIEEHPYN